MIKPHPFNKRGRALTSASLTTVAIRVVVSKSQSDVYNVKMNNKKAISKISKPVPKSPSILSNPALKDHQELELNEEWTNFMQRVGQVSGLVKDLASGDKAKADAAHKLADLYLEGKVIVDEEVEVKVNNDRTVINKDAFKTVENKDTGEIDKEAWMAEVSKDAEKRALDRKIRREKADTLKTMAVKAFRRGEFDKALSCYNKAIDQVKDNAMLYCDRALTNIKLGNFEKVFSDCDMALRINENSYKARLYQTKAFKETESDKFEASREELKNTFPQHEDLTKYFLNKKEDVYEEEEKDEEE